ncbi:hypothetical protein GOODEAATRI_020798 [Goodea atripinnis]|uniref:SAM domain-containing protein n=1 Tax=Goodea atripinnis TaxID=208336 RepID=A0ABV0MKJ6_9TELE
MSELDDRVSAWSSNRVAQWLQEEGFGQYVGLLCTQHRIDGLSLLALTEADLRGPPLSLNVLGDIKRLTVALRRLQMENKPELEELGLWPLDSLSAGLELSAPRAEWSCDGAERRGCNGADHLCNGPVLRLRNSSSLGCVPRAHYSIDVFIAFYITTRLFLYYHTLANTRAYQHSRRARIWFPMFSFFECNVNGPVPNQYHWPFDKPAFMKTLIG